MSQSITTSVAEPLPNSEKPSLPVDQLACLDDTLKVVPQSEQQTVDKTHISESTFPQDQSATRTDQEPSQFVALDQLKSSEPREALSEESAEVALMMGMESNDVIIGERLLKVIQTVNFPLKVVSIIKKLTKTYWQSHKTEAPDGVDKMKTFCFGNVMIAAFEIKQLSEEQLKNEKEIEVFRMNEEQIYSLGAKIVKLVSIRCKTDPNKEQEEWSMLLQRLEGEDAAANRRMMLTSTEVTEAEENGKPNEVSPSKTTEEPASALDVAANQETNKEETEENYNSVNNNNLSIQTQGHVTDLDISLPVLPNAEEQEPVATNDVKTATEGEAVNTSE